MRVLLAAAVWVSLLGAQTAPPDIHDVKAQAELIRSLLNKDDYHEAHRVALEAHKANPGDVTIRVLTGDTFFRMADLDNAYRFYLAGLALDPNNARAYLGAGRVDRATFRRKSMKNCFEKAWKLDPDDPEVMRAYASVVQKDDQRVALLEQYLDSGASADARQVRAVRNTIEFLGKAQAQKETQLVSGYRASQLKIERIMQGPQRETGAALRVTFNGTKTVVLMLDTGASGIVINEKTAEKAGIASLSSSEMWGIGDGGAQKAFFGVADRVKTGEVEFANVPVRIAQRDFAVGSDGLIGADVFDRFLIRLDLQHATIDLETLPGEDGTGRDWMTRDAVIPQDRGNYVVARRSGSHLFIPAVLDGKRSTWFLVDTGSSSNFVDKTVMAEVGKIFRDDHFRIKGISGRVNDVAVADTVTVTFGNLRQKNPDLVALDLLDLSRGAGMEIGGILGWDALSHLVLTLNYRDGLVDFTYEPPIRPLIRPPSR
jgi:predicted aspartyl protease